MCCNHELCQLLLKISVCKMEKTKGATFSRGSNHYLEIEAMKDDDYTTFVNRVAVACDVTAVKGKMLRLFKLNGAEIRNVPMMLKGYRSEKPWTLPGWMLMKKAASQVKVGVGVVDAEPDSNNESEVSY